MTRCLTALGSLTVLAATAAVAQDSKPFASRDGGYVVRFPGTPKQTVQTTDTKLGKLTATTNSFARENGTVFLVVVTDYPAEQLAGVKPADFLAGARDGLKGPDGKVDDDDAGEFDDKLKLPARDVVIHKGSKVLRGRLVLRGNRLYQVLVFGSKDAVKGDEAKGFIRSFDLRP